MTRKMRIELGLLKVGAVAREAQVLSSTVRYYTEIGILKVKEMTDTGYMTGRKRSRGLVW